MVQTSLGITGTLRLFLNLILVNYVHTRMVVGGTADPALVLLHQLALSVRQVNLDEYNYNYIVDHTFLYTDNCNYIFCIWNMWTLYI